MKRRSFIIKSALGGLAISMLPPELFATKNSKSNVYDFPFGKDQLRHGVFSKDLNNSIRKEEVLDYLEKNIFFRNGINKSERVLLNLSFRFKGKQHSCSWISDKVHLNSNEFLTEANLLIQINEDEPEVFALQLNGRVELKSYNGFYLFPLEGYCNVNHQRITSEEYLVQESETVLIEAESEVKLILINKVN